MHFDILFHIILTCTLILMYCLHYYRLGEVVQEKITESLRDKHACLMYDGLSRDSVAYTGVYASIIEEEGTEDERQRIFLLGVSPMPALPEEDVPGNDDDMEMDGEAEPHYAARFKLFGCLCCHC